MSSENYSRNVFINCPYDKEYKGLMDAIIFTVISLGYEPRLALLSSNSGVNRIDNILQLIKESQFGIHDLSRMRSKDGKELARFNMPFELGIDYGCRKYLSSDCGDKVFLILDKEKYDYQKAISDLSGVDIRAHDNNIEILIECIRNWFVESTKICEVSAAIKLFYEYTDFQLYLLSEAKKRGYNEMTYSDKITTVEFIDYVKRWKIAKA